MIGILFVLGLWVLLNHLLGDTLATQILLGILALVAVYVISPYFKELLVLVFIIGFLILIKKILTNRTKQFKVVTSICVTIGVIGAVLFLHMDFQKMDLKRILKDYGFQDAVITKALVNNQSNLVDYKITFSELNAADYETLLQMAEEIDTARESWTEHDVFANIWYYNEEDVYDFDPKNRVITKNYQEVYNDYFNSEGYEEDKRWEQEQADEKQEMLDLYGNKYPELDMPESALEYTKLGAPNRIEKSKDFSSKRLYLRFKTYYWNETPEHGRWSVVVSYGHWNSSLGTMVTYPEGKVTSITYFDEAGYHQIP